MSLRHRIFGKKTAAALVAAVLLFAFDLTRAPERQWTGKALVLAIDAYQATLSPAMGSMGVRCRFTPSCSRYTEAAIRHRGTVAGVALGVRRIARCGPWTPLGTVDPPPEPLPREPPQSITQSESL